MTPEKPYYTISDIEQIPDIHHGHWTIYKKARNILDLDQDIDGNEKDKLPTKELRLSKDQAEALVAELRKPKPSADYSLPDDNIVQLKGPNCEDYIKLMDRLKDTRVQTDLGIQIYTAPSKALKALLPEEKDLVNRLAHLNRIMKPFCWSVKNIRNGRKGGIPAEYFLKGPNDPDVNSNHPQPNKEEIPKKSEEPQDELKRILVQTKKNENERIAKKSFDRQDFSTRVVLVIFSNLANDDAAKDFTKDPRELLDNLLPTGVKLDSVIEDESHGAEGLLVSLVLSALERLKHANVLSEKDKKIIDNYQQLRQKDQFKNGVIGGIWNHFGIKDR